MTKLHITYYTEMEFNDLDNDIHLPKSSVFNHCAPVHAPADGLAFGGPRQSLGTMLLEFSPIVFYELYIII